MRIVIACTLVVLAALGGGCLGSGSVGGSHVNSGGTDRVVPASTAVTLTWPTGTPSLTNDHWWTLRHRTLYCPTHPEAGSDCAALMLVVHAVRHQHVFCPCVLQVGPSNRIKGSYRGHPINLPLTSCNLCGSPRAVTRAFAQLFPR